MSNNETLNEVKDPIAKAKLEGLQEAAYGTDALIIQTRKSIDEKRGVCAAAKAIADRLFLECGPHQKAVEEERMDSKEAKLRISQINYLVSIVRGMEVENQNDLVKLQGQIVGMEKAVKEIERKFIAENAKYQRWERIQREENEEVEEIADTDAEGGTSAKQAHPPKGESAEKKPQAKTKKKTIKAKKKASKKG